MTTAIKGVMLMRILVVEDEKSLARALVKIFEKNNYSADAVYNGLDANGRPEGFPTYFRNELSNSKPKSKKEKTNFSKDFAKICEEIPIEEMIEYLNSKRRY
jgi:DNA-binding NtrC family response regulator